MLVEKMKVYTVAVDSGEADRQEEEEEEEESSNCCSLTSAMTLRVLGAEGARGRMRVG